MERCSTFLIQRRKIRCMPLRVDKRQFIKYTKLKCIVSAYFKKNPLFALRLSVSVLRSWCEWITYSVGCWLDLAIYITSYFGSLFKPLYCLIEGLNSIIATNLFSGVSSIYCHSCQYSISIDGRIKSLAQQFTKPFFEFSYNILKKSSCDQTAPGLIAYRFVVEPLELSNVACSCYSVYQLRWVNAVCRAESEL